MSPLQRALVVLGYQANVLIDNHILKCRWYEWCCTEAELWERIHENKWPMRPGWLRIGEQRWDWYFPQAWWGVQRLRALAERILLRIVA